MTQYIITYIGGDNPATPEEGQKHFAKYTQWLQSLGSAVVSPANPFKNTHTVHPDGTVSNTSSTNMTGYTIIETDSMEKALEAAKSCPFRDINGTMEVAELVKMPV